MKRIKKIVDVFFQNKIILLALIIYSSFHIFFESQITKYLINPFFSTFSNNIVTKIFFCLICAFFIYKLVIQIKKNRKISDNKFIFAAIGLIAWAYYRFVYKAWMYENVWNVEYIKYIDVIILPALTVLIPYILYREKKTQVQNGTGFKIDSPIEDIIDDTLGRKKDATILAEKIQNTLTDKGAFTIGIVAPWGYGKTSFLNLLSKIFSIEDSIVIRFNPWMYEKNKNLTSAFFTELSSNLKSYDSNLVTDIMEYVQILSKVENTPAKLLAGIFEYKHTKDFTTRFNEINKIITEIRKKIIIMIDDLDRLDKYEIAEILKLIRNSANFSHMIFIAAYDKNYLNTALQQINSYDSVHYLEKIFQFEYVLPDFDHTILKNTIENIAKEFIQESDKEELRNALNSDMFITKSSGFVDKQIKTIRDVIRFTNSFCIIYNNLKGNSVIADLMNIELLKMRFPTVYDLFAKQWNSFLISNYEHTPADTLNLWSNSNRSDDPFVKITTKKYIDFKEYINSNFENLKIKKEQIPEVLHIIERLFSHTHSSVDHKSIKNKQAISRYFYYDLLEKDIAVNEFNELWILSFAEIKKRIDEYVPHQSHSLVTQIAEKKPIDTDAYKKIIKALFYIASISGVEEGSYSIITKYVKMNDFFETEEDHKQFIVETIKENGVNVFISKYLYTFSTEYNFWNFILTPEEMIQLHVYFFEQSVEKCDLGEIITFFSHTIYPKWILFPQDKNIEKNEFVHNSAADTLFFNYVKNNADTVIPYFIENKDRENKEYYLYERCYSFWENWDNFEKFVNALTPETAIIKEFKVFMKGCRSCNYNKAIPFQFKNIPVKKYETSYWA